MSIAFTTLNIVAKAICRADLPYGLALTILSPNKVEGTWYNRTLTYELEPRKVMSKVERKIYVDETTRDGDYNFRIETEPMYGSPDKPAISQMLCDVVNVTVRVKGSYQDDITTHIVQ